METKEKAPEGAVEHRKDTKKSSALQIPASVNLISDAEAHANEMQAYYQSLRNNPNVPLHVIQKVGGMYMDSVSIALGLHDLQYAGNEDLSHFRSIANAMKRAQNEPETSALKIKLPVVRTEPTIWRLILEKAYAEGDKYADLRNELQKGVNNG